MTIRQLIAELNACDEDIKDYQVWVTFHKPLTPDIKLSGRSQVTSVPENVDIDNKRIYLKTNKP